MRVVGFSCPDDVLGALKLEAARQGRSVAKQVLFYVRAGLSSDADGRTTVDGRRHARALEILLAQQARQNKPPSR